MPTGTRQLDLSDPWTRFRYCTEPHEGHPGAEVQRCTGCSRLFAHSDLTDGECEECLHYARRAAEEEELATCVQGEELFGEGIVEWKDLSTPRFEGTWKDLK